MTPGNETVTVLRAGEVNEHGERLAETQHDLVGCITALGGSGESNERGETVTTQLTVYAPAGADVRATDRALVLGRLYEVVGEPAAWASPFTGDQFGTEIHLRRVSG